MFSPKYSFIWAATKMAPMTSVMREPHAQPVHVSPLSREDPELARDAGEHQDDREDQRVDDVEIHRPDMGGTHAFHRRPRDLALPSGS